MHATLSLQRVKIITKVRELFSFIA